MAVLEVLMTMPWSMRVALQNLGILALPVCLILFISLPTTHAQIATRRWILLMTVLLTIGVCSIDATFDMNVLEYQLVANHITQKECRQLIEALNETEFYLSHEMTGVNVPEDMPCIDLLLEWDKGPGAGKAFIGRILLILYS